MTCWLEYHKSVRRAISASVALFGLLLLPVVIVSSSLAQINGVPASVTSPGFGGRAINGTPSSVTSLGPNGFAPNGFAAGTGVRFFSTAPGFDRDGGHHRRHSHSFFPVFGGVYPVPVAVPYPVEVSNDAEDDSDYQGGPTIFDRRGRGAEAYIPPVKDAPPAHSYQAAADPPAPESPQPATVLVFKDGHQLEVGNYAIVGQTLYDLTPGHARRIALADLDLEATQKQNDDHGITFQLPPTAQAN